MPRIIAIILLALCLTKDVVVAADPVSILALGDSITAGGIVLLHSGHNSFAKDMPVPGIIRDTEAIIAEVRRINPEVKVLLAQVIPAGKLPKYSYIPELNRELAVLGLPESVRLNPKSVAGLPSTYLPFFGLHPH